METKCIISPFHDCHLNIASEEYFLKKFRDEENVFYIYINSPSIIIGRHQNAYAEINHSYVREKGIKVVRRLSGGGAVYHDLGNVNYGFITRNTGKDIGEVFREFTTPILSALATLGLEASFSGRNDLVLGDRKISGVAQYHTSRKTLLHGTLLFDSDMKEITSSLHVDPRKFAGKGISSVKSRVTNIREHLENPLTTEEFTQLIFREVLAGLPCAACYELSPEDQKEIEKLADEKYNTWEWVYGRSPKFSFSSTLRQDKGIIDIGLDIDQGHIRELKIYGDFFGVRDIEELTRALQGTAYEESEVVKSLKELDINDYIFGLNKEIFIRQLFHNQDEEN